VSYRIEFSPAAFRQIKKLSRKIRGSILRSVESLGRDPFQPGSRKLSPTDFRRIRVGDYRIVYLVKGDQLVVLIVRVADRREVYEKLTRLQVP